MISRLNQWFEFYKNDNKALRVLKKIDSNLEQNRDFFDKPFYNERGFIFFEKLGNHGFNEFIISLVVQAFVNLVSDVEDLNILVAYNNNDDLDHYADLTHQILSQKNFKVFRFENTQILPSVVNEAYNNISFDAAFYFNYQSEQNKYRLTIFDGQGVSVNLNVYEQIANMILHMNPNTDVRKIRKAPIYLKEQEIFAQYKNKIISLAKRNNDEKKISVYLANASKSFTHLAGKILGSLDFEYNISKHKIPNLFAFRPLNWYLRDATKTGSDLLYITDTSGTKLGVAISIGNKFKFLEEVELLILFLDLYLLDLKTKRLLSDKNYIVIPNYLIILLQEIIIKYQIKAYPIEKFDNKKLDKTYLLFSMNRDNLFKFNSPSVNYYDQLQFIVIFSELMNYYKTQRGALANVLNHTLSLYKQIYQIKDRFITNEENAQRLISEIANGLFKEIVNQVNIYANETYFMIINPENDFLIRLEFKPFTNFLYFQIFDLTGKKQIDIVNKIHSQINTWIKNANKG
ncbi:phosphomannomutase [Mycoplasma testudineum]|uniref:Phosphomannomutase n=1 Tax=Mycoplasma testudineum TaxID=244584 RepID=A0A4V3C2M9_9MOLU|nr:hypothetical protein [Mycoplasma testudineum]OYD26501.1 hypothetical protein CG473_03605 [Mycoplasma testudineum]TDO18989.1 phosphomannomutase [Mycoplasma testudineum]